MSFNVNDFRSQLIYDGARPNLFEVYLMFPANVYQAAQASQRVTFMAKAASLPASTIGVAELSYFGRTVKVPGNRTFEDWTITVINDEDFAIKNAFENWMNLINSHVGNVRDPSMINALGYAVDPQIIQYGKTGDAIKSYSMVGAFPTNVAAIDMDWGSNDTIEEFSVTLTYQYWTSDPVTDR